MKRIVGIVMAIGGLLIAPPLWDGMAEGGLRSVMAFGGALALIAAGSVLSLGTGHGKASRTQNPDSRF